MYGWGLGAVFCISAWAWSLSLCTSASRSQVLSTLPTEDSNVIACVLCQPHEQLLLCTSGCIPLRGGRLCAGANQHAAALYMACDGCVPSGLVVSIFNAFPATQAGGRAYGRRALCGQGSRHADPRLLHGCHWSMRSEASWGASLVACLPAACQALLHAAGCGFSRLHVMSLAGAWAGMTPEPRGQWTDMSLCGPYTCSQVHWGAL